MEISTNLNYIYFMDLEQAIHHEKELHPLGTSQDLYKLIYQSCLGNGHMIKDEQDAYDCLMEEWKQAVWFPVQEIGNGYIRMPLIEMKEEDLLLWNELLIESAKTRHTHRAFDQALAKYGFFDRGPVSHSQIFKENYSPHYRVIRKEYVDHFSLFKACLHAFSMQKIVLIDGPCASGKTTAARYLSSFFECPCIHMDDYFLPSSLKTKERLRTPGGNIDHERFYSEVVVPFLKKEDLCLRPFDCHTQTYRKPIHLEYTPFLIIEGCYSHHPAFEELNALKIYLDISQDLQKARLEKRSPSLIDRFLKEWIPMEELYFSTYSIKEKSDYVFSR